MRERAAPVAHRPRVSGIGPAIAKRLCDLHGWQLEVSSPLAAGRGTAFTISFAGADAQWG